MSLKRMATRFEKLGCVAEALRNGINLDIDGSEIFLEVDDDWVQAITSFYKARQYSFDLDNRALFSNKTAEYLIVPLDPGFFRRAVHEFEDSHGNTVSISPASKEFLIAYFESERYENSFHQIKDRVHRRVRLRSGGLIRSGRTGRVKFRPDDLIYSFHTATYTSKRKPRSKRINDVALDRIKACLFALAYKKNESWELSQEIKAKGLIYSTIADGEDEALEIPAADYDSATVTLYKVAKSSRFPSQVFLSYYHILEYHFLRVADESLFNAVCSQLNDPSFKARYENVNRLLATIKRNDTTVDEKQMLLGVLRKYVAEEEYIEFIKTIENNLDDKIYTDQKQQIFGETFTIRLEKGHALSNTSTVLKHIRNALVHSSDRYARGDAFLPMSESETVVVKYIPIIQYLAERVIFATART